ncbi:MAG: hypothetical protein AB4352_07105 [Hormoscilla sp.]
MKGFFQTTIAAIVLLGTVTGLVGDAREASSHGNILTVAQNRREKPPIPLSLPNKARVWLEDGTSRSGQVVGMDGQKLRIKKGSSRGSLPIDQIDHVKLEGDIWWPNSTGYLVMRGEDTPAEGKNKVFLVGIDGLEWENSERGIVKILPEAVMEVDGRSGMPRAMRGLILSGYSRYVVKEMRFNPEEGRMEITATAQSRQRQN